MRRPFIETKRPKERPSTKPAAAWACQPPPPPPAPPSVLPIDWLLAASKAPQRPGNLPTIESEK